MGGMFGGLLGGKTGGTGGGGGLMGKLGGGSHGSGGHGGYMGGGGYPAQQVVYTQAPKKSGGMGMGTMALAGGAGLVGGLLVADAIDDMGDSGGFDDDFGGDF
ncbi:hypothetical protein NLJ89_g10996 [Agrocybe chaxingu]|uniref:Uncharacterized protein n=1 Tax=Agrocybe chaxingu TaxID=84603 RepID=A0A9W8JQS1_9AGAR|nr:hypothetical protein NLJ89_g10996 [Agrocybe chaxingu]